MNIPIELRPLLDDLVRRGCRPHLVGGCIRDTVFNELHSINAEVNDWDVEVFGVTVNDLKDALAQFGKVDTFGATFGILEVKIAGQKFQFAVPRRENAVGVGHTDFAVSFDADMTVREAASRRDFTMNAMSFDWANKQIVDPFNGMVDIERHTLRHVSDKFGEDALRVLRGMQFVSRFDLTPAPETVAMCRSLLGAKSSLTHDRVRDEWLKWARSSRTHRNGLEFLAECGWLEVELQDLIGCQQNPVWHPEGDVWTHTLFCLDAMDDLALNKAQKTLMPFAVLAHDLGKPSTTQLIDGVWKSPRHDKAGVPVWLALSVKLGLPIDLSIQVSTLVETHMAEPTKPSSVRRLLVALGDVDFNDWLTLVYCDSSGRPPEPRGLPEHAVIAQEIFSRPEEVVIKPLVTGDKLLSLGFSQGKELGAAKRAAFEAQLEGLFTTAEGGVEWLRQNGIIL